MTTFIGNLHRMSSCEVGEDDHFIEQYKNSCFIRVDQTYGGHLYLHIAASQLAIMVKPAISCWWMPDFRMICWWQWHHPRWEKQWGKAVFVKPWMRLCRSVLEQDIESYLLLGVERSGVLLRPPWFSKFFKLKASPSGNHSDRHNSTQFNVNFFRLCSPACWTWQRTTLTRQWPRASPSSNSTLHGKVGIFGTSDI